MENPASRRRTRNLVISDPDGAGILYASDHDTLLLTLELLERDGWSLERVPDGYWLAVKDGRVLKISVAPSWPAAYYVGIESAPSVSERAREFGRLL